MFRLRARATTATPARQVLDSGPPGFPGRSPYVQVVTGRGGDPGPRRRRGRTCRSTDADEGDRGRPGGGVLHDATVDGVHVRIFTGADGSARLRAADRPAAGRGRRVARPHPAPADLRRRRRRGARRRARAARRPRGARPRAAPDARRPRRSPRPATSRAHRGDRARTSSRASPRPSTSMLVGPRGLCPRAATARRRRLARAAHAAHQPPDEHRGARARAASCPRASARASMRDVTGAAEGDDGARRRARRARSRRRRLGRAEPTSGSTSSRRTRSSGRGETVPGVTFEARPRARAVVHGVAAAIERAVSNLARQRGEVEPVAGGRRRGRRRATAR